MDKLFDEILQRHKDCTACASPKEVEHWFYELLKFFFPDLAEVKFANDKEVKAKWKEIYTALEDVLSSIDKERAKEWTELFFAKIPELYNLLKADVKAHYEGDPAAKSEKEVIVSYPGFWAVASYRVANMLYKMDISIVPRLITENAHSKTGIDIHPGASIGNNFCIDHGTGIVIGETTNIGNNVKIYQGVTLGALSVDKKDADTKRHPTIEDGVVIYAGATILGGRTTIGKGSVIGGNVWITRSVEPNSKVYYKNAVKSDEQGDLDLITIITDK